VSSGVSSYRPSSPGSDSATRETRSADRRVISHPADFSTKRAELPRVVKVASTIADVAEADHIAVDHVAEAVQFRMERPVPARDRETPRVIAPFNQPRRLRDNVAGLGVKHFHHIMEYFDDPLRA